MKLRLKELREEKGWTMDQLHDVSGLSRGFISQLENGKRSPSSATLMALSGALGVPVGALFVDDQMGTEVMQAMDGLIELTSDDRAVILRLIETMRAEAALKSQKQ